MKRQQEKKQQQTSNDRESDVGQEGDYGAIPTFSSSEKKDHGKTSKKVTVSLALDEFVVEEIRKQADKSQVSFNARVNAIVEKYVKFFMFAEEVRAAVILPSTHQFFVNEIDETKYTAELKRVGKDSIDAIFTQTGVKLTFDNLIKHVFENICVNGGSIRTIKKYLDEDRRVCLFFTHDYDIKWSRMLSAAFAYHIQSLFHYHTMIKVFSKGFEIKMIEEGAKREFVETIRDPSEIQKIGVDLIKEAEEEILVLFSTTSAFRRQEKAGVLELLKEAAILRGVKVRILVLIDNNDNDNNATVSERIQQMNNAGIDIRTIKQTFQNKLTTLVIDQSLCLTVELKDDTKEESSDEAIGLATYSNSEATVFSYISIFENLWIQTQLHNKRRLKEEAVS